MTEFYSSERCVSRPSTFGSPRHYRPSISLPPARVRQSSPSCLNSVELVSLALTPSQLTVRAINLHNAHTSPRQSPGKTSTIGSGPLNADNDKRSERSKPTNKFVLTVRPEPRNPDRTPQPSNS